MATPLSPATRRRDSLQPGGSNVYVVVVVEEYVEFQTARTSSILFDINITIEEALNKIARRGNVYLQDAIKNFGLFQEKANGKFKRIENDKKLLTLGLKNKDKLYLKRIEKELITLTICFEGTKDKITKYVKQSFSVEDTVQDVLNKLVELEPTLVNTKEDDSCALFLPTRKSKKGIFMEKNRTLKSYNLVNHATILLKNREKEEIVLIIEIENYQELSCARTITSLFNTNATVQEAIQKIGRKGNVFIDDINGYRLMKDGKQMKAEDPLSKYNLKNRDNLKLEKKTGSFGLRIRSSSKPNAILLGEKTGGAKKGEFQFYSQTNEMIFRSLSRRQLMTDEEREAWMAGESAPFLASPLRSPFHIRKSQKGDEVDFKLVDSKQEEYNDTSPKLMKKPTPGKLGRIPKKEPVKRESKDIDDVDWQLVRIYHDPERFWTLAINRDCTIADICISMADKLDKTKSIYLHQLDKDGNTLQKLAEDHKVLDIKKSWSDSNRYIFFITQNDITTHEHKGEWDEEEADPWNEEIPENLKEKKDIEEILVSTLSTTTGSEDELRSSARKPTMGKKVTPAGSNSPIFIGQDEEKQKKWLDHNEVKRLNKISKGAFAKVYLGLYKDQEVAIKTLLGNNVTENQMLSFKSEFEILSSVKSQYLVEFIGAYVLNNKPSIVMEFCRNGSLYDVMNSKDTEFDWKKLMRWSMQMVKGVDTLHSSDPVLVHRDIKSLNLLLDSEWNVKVCDFGLSRFRTMINLLSLSELRGTMAYCAPEIYDGHIFSTKSDIYSIGVVLWEIVMRTMTGEYHRPFSEFEDVVFDFQIIIMTSKEKKRPTIPSKCPPSFAALISECWQPDPDKRPTCKEIIERLEKIEEELRNNPAEFITPVLSNPTTPSSSPGIID